MTVQFKICGVRSSDALEAAIAAGASYVGFVFYGPSPRNISAADAKSLSYALPPDGPRSVGLFVDPGDDEIDRILNSVALDMIQLHGRESPERVSDIRRKFEKPVIKAVGIGSEQDLGKLRDYAGTSDYLLLDSKADQSAALPGGRGESFNWAMLDKISLAAPWILSGGLTPGNVSDAIRVTGAEMVDVSSGVERMPGVKDPALIQAFGLAVSGARG